jgi:hypothetical protein
MAVTLDHVFVRTAVGAPEAEALTAAGLASGLALVSVQRRTRASGRRRPGPVSGRLGIADAPRQRGSCHQG